MPLPEFDVVALERPAGRGTLTVGLVRPRTEHAPWWIEFAHSEPSPAAFRLAFNTPEQVLAVRALLDLIEADMGALGRWPAHSSPTLVRPRTHPEEIEALFAERRAQESPDARFQAAASAWAASRWWLDLASAAMERQAE